MKSFILLDRSSSMGQRWPEVTSTLQTYLGGLPEGSRTFLSVFNTAFNHVVTGVPAEKVDLTHSFKAMKIAPVGMTALFDAINSMAALVKEHAKKRAQIVILTDGEENASNKTSKEKVGMIIKGWQEAGYDVIFLGADFDAFGEATNIGIGAGQTVSYNTVNASEMGATLATRATSYAETGAVTAFTDAERAAVGDPSVASKPKRGRKTEDVADSAPDAAPDAPSQDAQGSTSDSGSAD